MLIPVNGHKNLFRDSDSGAIVNCDTNGYNQYVKMKQDKKTQKDEIENMKNDIMEIKLLLKELVNGSK